jgi:O-antigen ligase
VSPEQSSETGDTRAIGKLGHLTRGLAEASILAIVISLPSAFNPFGVLAFEPLKASLLRCLALVGLVCWLISRTFGETKRPRLLLSPPCLAVGAVLAVTAASTVFSLNPSQSLFGSFQRGMGFLTVAAGAAVFIVGADLWADPDARERGITAVVVGALLPCAYALVQRLGRDPVPWSDQFGGAPASTLGSPTFLSGYLVVVAPFCWCRLLRQGQKAMRSNRIVPTVRYAAYLTLSLVLPWVVVLTTIRGALLGLVAGALVFAWLAARELSAPRRGLILLGSAGGLLTLTIVLAALATGSVPTVLDRFGTLTRAGSTSSASERLDLWSAALSAPLTDPTRVAVGLGPEMQPAVFERSESVIRRSSSQIWDRAHNLVMDTWLVGGALGVLALIGLTATCVRITIRWRKTDALVAAAVLASLAGHLVEQMFAFQTVATGTYFWIVLAIGASFGLPSEAVNPAAHGPGFRAGILAIGCSVVLIGLPLLAGPAIADGLHGAAARADAPEEAARIDEYAAKWAPWVEELPQSAALNWRAFALTRQGSAGDGFYSRAEDLFARATALNPYNSLLYFPLIKTYVQWNGHGSVTHSSQELLELAEAACVRALVVGPFRPSLWLQCADVSELRGLPDEAVARRARADQLTE